MHRDNQTRRLRLDRSEEDLVMVVDSIVSAMVHSLDDVPEISASAMSGRRSGKAAYLTLKCFNMTALVLFDPTATGFYKSKEGVAWSSSYPTDLGLGLFTCLLVLNLS